MDKEITSPLTAAFLDKYFKEGEHVVITIEEDRLNFQKDFKE
jgi:hypothetical protein